MYVSATFTVRFILTKQTSKDQEIQPKGIILHRRPEQRISAGFPDLYKKEIFELGILILGICYGSQLMMHLLGGKVEVAPVRIWKKLRVTVDTSSALFENVSEKPSAG